MGLKLYINFLYLLFCNLFSDLKSRSTWSSLTEEIETFLKIEIEFFQKISRNTDYVYKQKKKTLSLKTLVLKLYPILIYFNF